METIECDISVMNALDGSLYDVCLFACVYGCAYVRACVRLPVCVHACVRVCVCVCVFSSSHKCLNHQVL